MSLLQHLLSHLQLCYGNLLLQLVLSLPRTDLAALQAASVGHTIVYLAQTGTASVALTQATAPLASKMGSAK
jgi:hypothetical protein